MAHELEVDHEYTQLLRGVERALARHKALAGQSLPVNIDAGRAVCADIGLSAEVADALIIVSRLPGLVAHVLEEQQRERPMRVISPSAHRLTMGRQSGGCRNGEKDDRN